MENVVVEQSSLEKIKAFSEYADEYVGEVGEKLKDMKVMFANCRKLDDYHGVTYFVEFVDEQRHCVVWKTNKGAVTEFEVGDKFVLSGTVEAHDEYKGLKTNYGNSFEVDQVLRWKKRLLKSGLFLLFVERDA